MSVLLKSLVLAAMSLSAQLHAQEARITVASFNLGWWVDKPEFSQMVQACSAAKPAWCDPRKDKSCTPTPDTLPPCNAYTEYFQEKGQAAAAVFAPTESFWDAKRKALRETLYRVDADVLAFEEVSGEAAAQAVLGSQSDAYHFCASDLRDPQRPEPQRLVIAARKSVFSGAICRTDTDIRVQEGTTGRYTRPALIADLTTPQGQAVKVIALHLKSSCASPAGDEQYGFLGNYLHITDPNDISYNSNCPTLRKQVAPLERLIEREVTPNSAVIMLGDFNRKIHLEMETYKGPDGKDRPKAGPARESGSAIGVPADTDKVRLLWPEVNDGDPAHTLMSILPREDKSHGCTGFDGLDHITVSQTLQNLNKGVRVEEMPLKNFAGGMFPASDHCPLRTRLRIR